MRVVFDHIYIYKHKIVKLLTFKIVVKLIKLILKIIFTIQFQFLTIQNIPTISNTK